MATTIVDQLNPCLDCGAPFSFSVAEQLFYAERGVRFPMRCPSCRAQRRAERHGEAIRGSESTSNAAGQSETYGMFTGLGGSATASRRGARPAGTKSLFSATCSACGRPTEVPFEPSGGRPVYCRACFNARRGR